MTTYTYNDEYLRASITNDREQRAIQQVNDVSTAFSTAWMNTLVPLRAYIITCLECQANPDDLFASKLKHYREEWSAQIALAKDSVTDSTTGEPVFSSLSIPLERS